MVLRYPMFPPVCPTYLIAQGRMFAKWDFLWYLQPFGEHHETLDTLFDACRIDACANQDYGAGEREL